MKLKLCLDVPQEDSIVFFGSALVWVYIMEPWRHESVARITARRASVKVRYDSVVLSVKHEKDKISG